MINHRLILRDVPGQGRFKHFHRARGVKVMVVESRGKVNLQGSTPLILLVFTSPTLEELGFIIRKPGAITITEKARRFINDKDLRVSIFSEEVLKIHTFKTFIELLNNYKTTGASIKQLSLEMKKAINANWTEETGKTNVKIMLDWARHLNMAPTYFCEKRKGWTKQQKLF